MKLKLDGNFCDLLSAFRACSVRYLIIGGWAVSIHAQPRATQDMDIFVSPDRENLGAVYEALIQFGAPLKGMDKTQFLEPGTFFRIGAPPCQKFPGCNSRTVGLTASKLSSMQTALYRRTSFRRTI
jgi:hypothetical protein